MTKLLWMMALALLLAGALHADTPSPFIFVRSFNGSGQYNGVNFSFVQPASLAWGANDLYVGDVGLKYVYELDLTDAVVNRIGGAAADIDAPVGLFWTPSALYISDSDKGGVFAYYGTTSAQVGPAVLAQAHPSGIWADNGTLWMLDSLAGTLTQYNLSTGEVIASNFSNGFGVDQLSNPQDIAIDSQYIYIADTGNNRVEVFDHQLNFVGSWGTGRGGVNLQQPVSVASDGTHLYVADEGNNSIVVFGMDGYPLAELGGVLADNTTFSDIKAVRLGDDQLFVLDAGNKRVVEFALNWSNSEPQLLDEFQGVNASVQSYEASVLSVMDELNLSHAPDTLSAQTASAYGMIQAGQYAQALSLLSDVNNSLNSLELTQVQALRLALQSRIDQDTTGLQAYQGMQQTANQSQEEAVLNNQINDAENLLKNDQYANSAAVLLPLQPQLTAFGQSMNASLSEQVNTTVSPVESAQAAALGTEADNLSAQLQTLQAQMNSLHQTASLATLTSLIESGRQLATSGDYADANASLSAAEQQMETLAPALAAQQLAVDNASAVMAQAWNAVNTSSQAWAVIGFNSTPITSELAQAQALLYVEPAQAQQLAAQALAQAQAQDAGVQQKGAAVGWIALALVGVLAVCVAAVILLRTRSPSGGGSWKDWMARRMRRAKIQERLAGRKEETKKRGL